VEPRRRAYSSRLLRALASHHIFEEADNGCQDSASDAAADRLPNYRADIDVSGRSLKHWKKSSEKRSTARAADCSSNGITERTEVDILHRSACGIAADGTSDELNDEIDKRS
jgi:hypothetical protein